MRQSALRTLRLVLLSGVLVVIAACSGQNLLIEFEGSIITTGLTVPVEFRFLTYGQVLRGDYFIGGAETRTGRAEGTIDGIDLVMVIYEEREDGCVFDFEGTIDEEELQGIFEPREATGCGTGGTWDLTRVH